MSQCHLCPVLHVAESLKNLARIGNNLKHEKEIIFWTMEKLMSCIVAIWPIPWHEYCECGIHGYAVRNALFMLWLDVLCMTVGGYLDPVWVAIHDTEVTLALLKGLFQVPVFYPVFY